MNIDQVWVFTHATKKHLVTLRSRQSPAQGWNWAVYRGNLQMDPVLPADDYPEVRKDTSAEHEYFAAMVRTMKDMVRDGRIRLPAD